MVKFFACLLFLLSATFSTPSRAQDILLYDSFCRSVISGEDLLDSKEERERIVSNCFEDALTECAIGSNFTECISDVNENFLLVLIGVRESFDQSILDSPLPSKSMLWESFLEALDEAEKVDERDVDAQVENLKRLFHAAMIVTSLR